MASQIITGEDNETGKGILLVQTNLNGGVATFSAKLKGMEYNVVEELEDGFTQIRVGDGHFKIDFSSPAVVSVE